ncbi:MAG: peptidoglycan-binding domain-containing protein, partial [Myxococcales bacterium]
MKVLQRRVLPSQAKAVRQDLAAMLSQLKKGNPLNLGDKGRAVEALQRQLRATGVYAGQVTGTFDEATEAALKAFQQKSGLEASGTAGGRTFKALKAANVFVKEGFADPARQGQRGTDVLRAERMLERLGYRPGEADGVFDRQTQKALQRFRKADKQVSDDGKALTANLFRNLAQSSRAMNHDPYRRRELGGLKQHQRLDELTEKSAKKGDGIGLGAKGRAVLNLEKHLAAAGYDPGATNRGFTSRTEAAVKA